MTGKVGIARSDLKVSATVGGISGSLSYTNTDLAFAIGAQYDFTDNFAIRAQYENLGDVGDAGTIGTYKASLLSAGVIFNF